jgi:hypothetical protein
MCPIVYVCDYNFAVYGVLLSDFRCTSEQARLVKTVKVQRMVESRLSAAISLDQTVGCSHLRRRIVIAIDWVTGRSSAFKISRRLNVQSGHSKAQGGFEMMGRFRVSPTWVELCFSDRCFLKRKIREAENVTNKSLLGHFSFYFGLHGTGPGSCT